MARVTQEVAEVGFNPGILATLCCLPKRRGGDRARHLEWGGPDSSVGIRVYSGTPLPWGTQLCDVSHLRAWPVGQG